MRIRHAICILAAAMSAAATPAQGQQSSSGVGVGVMFGGTTPVSNYHDVAQTAWHVGAFVDFGRVAGPLGVRIEGMYHRFGDKNLLFAGGGLSEVSIENEPWIVHGDVNLNLGLSDTTSTIRPYLTGGGGVYYLKNTVKCKSELCGGEITLDELSETKFGLNGGAGLEFPLSGFSAFIEARYHYVFDAIPDRDCIGESGCDKTGAQFLPFTFGLTFRF